MNELAGTQPDTLLFGAFDRHNFGDLLFPHIVMAMSPQRRHACVGLGERDMRTWGGHRVISLMQAIAQWRELPLRILHAGGELLTCDAWEAAVMLLSAKEAQAAIAHFGRHPHLRRHWVRERIGIDDLAPYVLGHQRFPQAARVAYNAVGGVALGNSDPALCREVAGKLRAADAISVRDHRTQSLLCAQGVQARLLPDCAVMTAELFGDRIAARGRVAETAEMRKAFPRGYAAVQYSAEFGDERTLAEIAVQLERFSKETGQGIVLFRAGAAPWHDDLACYRRLVARGQVGGQVRDTRIFTSLDLWDICALIAHSSLYAGSSLHGRILAMAFALPRVNLVPPVHATQPSKQGAFIETWECAAMPAVTEPQHLAHAMLRALALPDAPLRGKADELAGIYREAAGPVLTG